MSTVPFTQLRVYRLSEDLADRVWRVVMSWGSMPRNTIGEQLVRAADSIGANIAEGSGRGTYVDNRRFVFIARGSLNETRHFLRRAKRRGLLSEKDEHNLSELVDELTPTLNAYLRSFGARTNTNGARHMGAPTRVTQRGRSNDSPDTTNGSRPTSNQ